MNKSLTLSIRLPEIYAGALSEYAIGYESPSQTAKRLLMELLDGKNLIAVETPQPPPSELGDIGDRLAKIEKSLDWAKAEILEQRRKVTGIESDAYWNDRGEILEKLAVVDDLMSLVANLPAKVEPEIAVMVEKKSRKRKEKPLNVGA